MLLTVCFPPPGFFFGDTQLRVLLDGHEFYLGSFMAGFTRTVELAPGLHRLHIDHFEADLFRRSRDYPLELAAPDHYRDTSAWTLTVRYSRFWGAFPRTVVPVRSTV